MVEDYNCLRK